MTTLRRNRVDLHTHTDRSDGVLSPSALHAQMAAYGMALVAITDHDTIAGAVELRAAGAGIPGRPGDGAWPPVLIGVEINTVGTELLGRHGLGRDGEELHILGYGLDPDDPALAAALARQRSGRRDRLALTLERVAALGLHLDLDASGSGGEDAVGRPHVARALVRAGHARNVEDAFARFLGHDGPCYVPRQGLGPRAAIEAITAAGGIAALAHSPEAPERPEVIATLREWGMRGLEVHYRRFGAAVVARMEAFAAAQGLLATGGSDYHGDEMDYATAQQETWVPDAAGDRLLEAIAGSRG